MECGTWPSPAPAPTRPWASSPVLPGAGTQGVLVLGPGRNRREDCLLQKLRVLRGRQRRSKINTSIHHGVLEGGESDAEKCTEKGQAGRCGPPAPCDQAPSLLSLTSFLPHSPSVPPISQCCQALHVMLLAVSWGDDGWTMAMRGRSITEPSSGTTGQG